jgi:hypothetical protein
LPAPQFLRRQNRRAFLRQWNIEQRGEERGIFRRVELNLRERIFQIGKALLRRRFGAAESLAAPFGNRMQAGCSAEAANTSIRPSYGGTSRSRA